MYLLDRFGRPLTKLRISVTDRCNLRCIFCHMEGMTHAASYEATPDEIATVVKAFAEYGVDDVKITGGEPLLRDDICEIVSRISEVDGIRDISITTNATLLEDLAYDLKKNGLKRINVNLPTLDPEVYRKITGGDVRRVYNGILRAKEAGIWPIKINMLLLKGFNEEIDEMLDFVFKNGLILQLIELEPLGRAADEEFFRKYHVGLSRFKERLEKMAEKKEIRSFQKRTVYYLRGGKVEVVDPLENTSFCLNCTRMRVTPDLKLKPCLMRDDNLVEIGRPVTLERVKMAILEANRRRKPYFLPSDYEGILYSLE